MPSILRTLRILWIALVIALGLYVYLPEALAVGPKSPSPVVFLFVSMITVLMVGSAFLVRRKRIVAAEAALASAPGNPKALEQWRTGYVICLALSESLGLYGLVLRFIGFGFAQVAPFYLAGAGLLLFFFPRAPQTNG